METVEPEEELSSGYKLVPWSSWDQWNFVRESLFSSSPDSITKALQRISAWRSRGCLPVPVDVTAAFVEIQQKDHFFREGANGDDSTMSEELLSMLYCMAIMRLVNGFVEPAHKKTGLSISQLADAVGIPRMLVDIRHESSHRGLPSLPLVRLATVKALDWLRSNYWEPQRNAIPDVRKEIRSRLNEMIFLLNTKHSQRSRPAQVNRKRAKRLGMLICTKLSSQIVGKLQLSKSDGSKKQISRITKRIGRLYSSYPSEVVSVLLEFFHLQAPDFSDDVDMEHSDDSSIDDPGSHIGSLSDLKTIITEVSSKKPGLILSILKAVLEIIEANETTQGKKGICHFLTSKHQSERAEISHFCSLVHLLLLNLKALKESCQIGVSFEDPVLPTGRNAAPKVSLRNLFYKCLSLSVLGDKHLSASVLLLAEMIGNNSLSKKLEKIPLLRSQGHLEFVEDTTLSNTSKTILQEEASIKQATEKLELLKSHIQSRSSKGRSSMDGNKDANDGAWSLCTSWIPCPIGMIPCSFSSTAVLPVLDMVDEATELDKAEMSNKKVDAEMSSNYVENDHITEMSESDGVCNENESASKRLRMSREVHESDLLKKADPFEGSLLIGGTWKKVSEEELLAIESSIRIFA